MKQVIAFLRSALLLCWIGIFHCWPGQVFAANVPVDLNGKWEVDNNASENPGAKIFIFQLHNVIQVFNAGGWRFIKPGEVFVRSSVKDSVTTGVRYQAEIRASKDGSTLVWYIASLLIDDRDHIIVANRFRFHRTSTSTVEDLPCENGNPRHVAGDEASWRSDAYFALNDFVTSVCWSRIGAIAGNARSQASYAYALYAGRGIKQDLSESKVWAEKGANQHDPYAERTLAGIYSQMGFGLGLDQARELMERAKQHDPDKVYLGEQTEYMGNSNAPVPAFRRDPVFTYDLSGEWKMTFPPSVKRPPLVVIGLEQKDQKIEMTADAPNSFYPFGQVMFEGKYRDGKILGEWMDAPAHKIANGDYASTTIELQIKKPTELITPAGIRLTRSDELGANQICDARKYASLDSAYAFNYGVRDVELRNFGNAACWMYVSASQGHHQAQFELGAFLHLGIGVERDDKQSFLWLSRSAEQGNKRAQSLLAHYYKAGIGIAPSAASAKSWTAKANDGQAEPEPPKTTEQQFMGLIQTVVTTVCGNIGGGHTDRVSEYERRGMSSGQAEQAARDNEAETSLFCRLTAH